MHGFFALDYDVLLARHWWDNPLAISTFDELKELANAKFTINKNLIIKTCTQEPNKLNFLLGLNNEIKTLTENMMEVGKGVLHEGFLNNTTNVDKLNTDYIEMENKVFHIHDTIEKQLENCRISQSVIDSGIFEETKISESVIVDEVRKLWENNIYSEVKATFSPTIATYRSPSSIPHSTSLSPILEELKKLPTISR